MCKEGAHFHMCLYGHISRKGARVGQQIAPSSIPQITCAPLYIRIQTTLTDRPHLSVWAQKDSVINKVSHESQIMLIKQYVTWGCVLQCVTQLSGILDSDWTVMEFYCHILLWKLWNWINAYYFWHWYKILNWLLSIFLNTYLSKMHHNINNL